MRHTAQKLAALTVVLLLLVGCSTRGATRGDRGASIPAHGGADVDATATLTAESVVLRDPLAGLDLTQPVTPPGNRYQRFVTAGWDSLASVWQRDRIDAWNAWAATRLQDGDIVFIESEGNLILGVIDFSKLTREVTESLYTHVGIVALENGEAVVYDTVVTGPGRRSFGQTMVLPDIVGVAVKRLRPAYRPHIPGALAYCRHVHQRQVGFDKKLRLDNDALYCTEMIEVAFRSTGLPLSRPIRWDALPGFANHPVAVNAIRLANDAKPDEYVVVPGNDEIGMWASPLLELVLDHTAAAAPPLAHTSVLGNGTTATTLSRMPRPETP